MKIEGDDLKEYHWPYSCINKADLREFDTSVIKKVPLSLVIGLFFCQPFCFVI